MLTAIPGAEPTSTPSGAASLAVPEPAPVLPQNNDSMQYNDPEAREAKDYSCLPVHSLKALSLPKWHGDLKADAFAHHHAEQPKTTRQVDVEELRKAIKQAKETYPDGVRFLHFDGAQSMPQQIIAWHNSFSSIPNLIYFVDSIGE